MSRDPGVVLAEVMTVYRGSRSDATKRLYDQLAAVGVPGALAVDLLRAQKNSERAKLYRGGGAEGRYKMLGYRRKDWALKNLCETLEADAHTFRPPIRWGWGRDLAQPFAKDVLYIELPTGQVSFHTEHRGPGPAYSGRWDGAPGTSPSRICRFAANVLAANTVHDQFDLL